MLRDFYGKVKIYNNNNSDDDDNETGVLRRAAVDIIILFKYILSKTTIITFGFYFIYTRII